MVLMASLARGWATAQASISQTVFRRQDSSSMSMQLKAVSTRSMLDGEIIRGGNTIWSVMQLSSVQSSKLSIYCIPHGRVCIVCVCEYRRGIDIINKYYLCLHNFSPTVKCHPFNISHMHWYEYVLNCFMFRCFKISLCIVAKCYLCK